MENKFTEERFLNGQGRFEGETRLLTARLAPDGGKQATEDINRLVQHLRITLPKKAPMTTFEAKAIILSRRKRRTQPSELFSNDFSYRLLGLVAPKHLERTFEPSMCDAVANRLERVEKDGNEVAANLDCRREMCKAILMTFLTLPTFYIGEILSQIRRMVAR